MCENTLTLMQTPLKSWTIYFEKRKEPNVLICSFVMLRIEFDIGVLGSLISCINNYASGPPHSNSKANTLCACVYIYLSV